MRWRDPLLTPDDHAVLDRIDRLDWDPATWRFEREWEAIQVAAARAEARRMKRGRGRVEAAGYPDGGGGG